MAIETEFVFLQPSDVLVVPTTAYMHQGQRDHIVADIKAQLGADAKVLVLDGGLDLQVLRPAGVAEVQEDPTPAQRYTITDVALCPETYVGYIEAVEQMRTVEMLRKEYASASPEKRNGRERDAYVLDRARELDAQDAARQAEETTGAGSVLPAYSWVDKASLVDDQAAFAISHDEKNDCYAILDENLTYEQRIMLGVA